MGGTVTRPFYPAGRYARHPIRLDHAFFFEQGDFFAAEAGKMGVNLLYQAA